MKIKVECYAGHKGEETPRRLWFDETAVDVVEVLDRWLAPDHGYFKLVGANRATYIVRNDTGTGDWELVMYEKGSA